MELVLSLAIGALAGSGVWLLLRPRTFQVIIGLALLSYAVTHRMALGSHVWVLFEPPAGFMRPAAALRNSIRMAWPLAYALMFGAIRPLGLLLAGRERFERLPRRSGL